MKRSVLLISLLVVALVAFASAASAQQASVFGDGVLVSAYVGSGVCSGDSTRSCTSDLYCLEPQVCTNYSASLDVRDATGVLLNATDFSVTGVSPTATPDDVTVNPFLIHHNDLVNNDISITYNSVNKTVYVFCTDATPTGAPNLHVMKYLISRNIRVDGECVYYSTGLDAQPTNLCVDGSASDVSVTGLGWSWTCYGNGIDHAENAYCSAYKKVNGVCGSSSGQTLPSAPTSNLCSSGTATTVTGSGPWTWTCTGLHGGSTSPTCTANSSQTGNRVDLAITSISAPTGCFYGATWAATVTVANQSSNAAGAFTVKYYQGSATTGTYLGTVTVSGLAANASMGVSITPRLYIPAHVWSYVTVVVVPNALDTDTQTSDNSAIRAVTGN